MVPFYSSLNLDYRSIHFETSHNALHMGNAQDLGNAGLT